MAHDDFFIFRLHSDLETPSKSPVLDIMEPLDGEFLCHNSVSIETLDTVLYDSLKDSKKKAVLLVPTEYARVISIENVGANRRKIHKSVPYLVEETLAGDLSENHIAISASADHVTAIVTTNEAMEFWRSTIQEFGVQLTAIYRDIDTLQPTVRGYALVANNRAILAWPEYRAALSLKNLPIFLEALPQELVNSSLSSIRTLDTHIDLVEGYMGDFGKTAIRGDSLPWFPHLYNFDHRAINLAQGKYSPSSSFTQLRTPHWAVIVVVLFVLLASTLAYYGAGFNYETRTDELKQRQAVLYRELFPDDNKIVNIPVQMRQHIEQLSHTSSTNRFSKIFVTTLRQLNEITDLTLGRVQYIQYQSSPTVLGLEVTLDSVKQLDKLKQALLTQGLIISVETVSQQETQFIARIRVEPECEQC